MKRYEVKKLGILSVFKVMMYMMVIPVVIFLLIGVIMAIVGFATQSFEIVIVGILIAIGYPIMFLFFYGLFGSLAALIYNGLAGKFGGLELTLNELDKPRNEENKQ